MIETEFEGGFMGVGSVPSFHSTWLCPSLDSIVPLDCEVIGKIRISSFQPFRIIPSLSHEHKSSKLAPQTATVPVVTSHKSLVIFPLGICLKRDKLHFHVSSWKLEI
ncbi:hypothetical protein RRG08_005977 [Elysia crispata]|uniref:Uncharacterized protein n=1 Tax=Elysia crispata TaxID=231223 RepID=A0AAE1D2D5_9GAST|nr:hypothetical protein RRG08_005977 [Elysia crispata]